MEDCSQDEFEGARARAGDRRVSSGTLRENVTRITIITPTSNKWLLPAELPAAVAAEHLREPAGAAAVSSCDDRDHR